METNTVLAFTPPRDFTTVAENTEAFPERSPSPATERLNFAGGADWDVRSEAPVVIDNRHIVIPLMSFVFGFPVLVITVLCIIQQRNKRLYERQHMRLQQQRRFSTASTAFSGYPSSSRVSACALHKDVASYGPTRSSVVTNGDSSPSVACSHKSSIGQGYTPNGILVTGVNPNGQRSRKQSTLRFTDTIIDEQEMDTLTDRQPSCLNHNHTSCVRSPLLNVGPQNILDKFGYVDA